MPEILQRLAVTAWVLGMAWAGTRVMVPGVTLPAGADPEILSVVTLGVTPLVTGFLLVELVAFAVPVWRPLVRGGPAERARLWWAGVAVAAGVAAVQGFTMAVATEQMDVAAAPGPSFRFTFAGAVALATVGFAAGARIVDQHGLGSGFAVLTGAVAARELAGDLTLTGVDLGWIAAAIAAGLVVRGAAPPGAAWGAGGVATVGRMASVAGSPGAASGVGLAAVWIVAALVGTATRPVRRVAGVGTPEGAVWHRRIAVARANRPRIVLRLGAIATLVAAPEWLGASSPVGAIVVALVVVDLVEEIRVRSSAPGPLVVAWSIHQPYLVAPALAALQAAGIPAAVRSLRTRTWFGPWDPRIGVDVLVPEGQRDAAASVLTAALAVGAPPPRDDAAPQPAPGPPVDPWAAPIQPV